MDFNRLCRVVAVTIVCTVAAGCHNAVRPLASDPAIERAVVSLDGVTDSITAARKLKSACAAKKLPSHCYESTLEAVASTGKVRFAMGTLDELGKIDENVRRGGHVYAHAIGIAAGKRGENIAGTFPQCSETYQSGCYHGVIQAYFSGLDSIGASEANALCEAFRSTPADRWIRFQCVHGMGHGLTMLYAHDLPRGLKGCDLLLDAWDRHSCYGGAFMENIVNVMMPHHPASELAHHDDMDAMAGMEGMEHTTSSFKPIDPSDPLYPCSVVAGKYASACYEMQTSVILFENHGDIAAAAKTCETAPPPMRTICYVSLGRDISSYSAQNHAEGMRMCSLGSPVYQPWCYFGLVKNYIDLNARPSDGMSLCREVTSAANKAECYSAVGEQIWLLAADTESRTRLCAPAEADYVEVCLFGARVNPAVPATLQAVWNAVRTVRPQD